MGLYTASMKRVREIAKRREGMGMYSMCPACKAANRPCYALNCWEHLKAVGHNASCKPHERVRIPDLIYPPSTWQQIKRACKHIVVWLVKTLR